MLTASPTRTDAATATLHVDADGVRDVRCAMPIAFRQLRGERNGVTRVGMVQTGAMLVGDDDLLVEVCADAGARLELCDISATLAHAGADARWRMRLTLREDARVAVLEEPFIVAAGARVSRDVHVAMGPGARLLHRETLVLGRHGEPGGQVRARTRVERGGRPVLDDTLDTTLAASPVVLGGARMVTSVGLYGVEAPAFPGAFSLGPRDALLRVLGPVPDVTVSAWREALA